MKALLFTGVKEPLVYTDVELPEPDESFGVVRLKAAALNRRDYWITLGLYPNLRFPSVLGSDGCGVYEGKEVVINPSIHWGDDPRFYSDDYFILGMVENGTFAEQVAVRKTKIYPKPEHLTAEQAAALPLAGLTAYRILFSRCQARAGDKVLISGIGGGVALLACQFAIAAGAEVWVTSGSPDKIDKAIAMGAKGGASYKNPDAMKQMGKAAGGFDVVIDSAGGKGFGQMLRLCRKGGRIGVYGGTAGSWEGVSVPNFFFKQLSIYGSTMGSDAEFGQMLDFVRTHRIVPVVGRVFDLKDGNEALQVMKESTQFGKVVLRISS
ncbi:MAG: zinc-binding dehydrogenase [Phaeodactylibacter sp.]|nr:zinc-binding dehydrogenase [Phaeodactylibacter sp.]MCB9286382.1 zinc-binding dehydrogenase [Lewinellaceae bacterium]